MQKRRSIFGLYANFSGGWNLLLGSLLFLLCLAAWQFASTDYLAENPNGKLIPSFSQMGKQFWILATEVPRREDYPLLWIDIFASLKRLLTALFVSSVCAFFLGILMAFYPIIRAVMERFVTFCSNIPVIALLAILMIAFGNDEFFKFSLIFLGTVFIITRDIFQKASDIPSEQTTKALSLGASESGTVFRLMLPRLMPELFTSVRLVLGAAWIYLLTSEMISAQVGLGYRIFLVRRYMDMQTIIPYVVVIAALAFMLDALLRISIKKMYPWFNPEK